MGPALHQSDQRPQRFTLALGAALVALECSVIGAAEFTHAMYGREEIWATLSLPVIVGMLVWLIRELMIDLPGYTAGNFRQMWPLVKTDLCLGAMLVVFLGVLETSSTQIAFISLLVLLTVLCRHAAYCFLKRLVGHAGVHGPSRVVIVGSGKVAQLLAASLMKYEATTTSVLGFVDNRTRWDGLKTVLGLPIFAVESLEDLIEKGGANRVLFAFSSVPDSMLVKMMQICRSHRGVQVSMVPRFYEALTVQPQLIDAHGLPMVQIPREGSRMYAIGKQLFDRTCAALGLIICLPIVIVAAAAVRIESPGPIFFRQQRVGHNGSLFTMYKLRSMREAMVGENENAPSRWTRVGALLRKTSIDELPQLWNVLRGDMSLVGPRPEREEYVQLFSRQIPNYYRRHEVRGGLTGLAQVKGLRGATSIVERTRLDLYYVEHHSFRLDLQIILRTFTALMPSSQGIGGESMFMDLVSEVADRQVKTQASLDTAMALALPSPKVILEEQHTAFEMKGESIKGEPDQGELEPAIVIAQA